MESLAERLVRLRKKAGYTQEKAAQAIGITRAALNNYENGLRKPGYDVLLWMADFYGVPVEYLLGREDDYEPQYSEQTQILLQTLKGASEKEIAQAIKIVEALKGTMPDE